MTLEFPKIRKIHYKNYKYKVGRYSRGWWQLCDNELDAIKEWFWFLFADINYFWYLCKKKINFKF